MAVDDAMGAARASITDVHLYSGLLATLHFALAPRRLEALRLGLEGAGVRLDAASVSALEQLAASAQEEGTEGEDVTGVLAISFVDGDPTRKREIPRVPG